MLTRHIIKPIGSSPRLLSPQPFIQKNFYFGHRPTEILEGQDQTIGQKTHPRIYRRQCLTCKEETYEKILTCEKKDCNFEDTLVAVATTAKATPDGTKTLLLDKYKNLKGEPKPQRYNPVQHIRQKLTEGSGPIYDDRLNTQAVINTLEQEKFKLKDKDNG